MEAVIRRLEAEASDLEDRYRKLCLFIGSKAFIEISDAHIRLLQIQAEQMRALHGTLIVRIALLKAEAAAK